MVVLLWIHYSWSLHWNVVTACINLEPWSILGCVLETGTHDDPCHSALFPPYSLKKGPSLKYRLSMTCRKATCCFCKPTSASPFDLPPLHSFTGHTRLWPLSMVVKSVVMIKYTGILIFWTYDLLCKTLHSYSTFHPLWNFQKCFIPVDILYDV